MHKLTKPLLLGVLAAASVSPALAQQSGRQFVHDGLRKAGLSDADIAHGVKITTYRSRETEQGLRLEVAGVGPARRDPNAVNKSTVTAVIINPTRTPWCVRAKGRMNSSQLLRSGVTEHNFIVQPGQAESMAYGDFLLDATGRIAFNHAFAVAVWKPNLSAPHSSQCKSVEPDMLHEWLEDPEVDNDYDEWLVQDFLEATEDL